MYYLTNWFFLLALILMFNKIRHIKDKLKSRDEIKWLIIYWSTMCFFQYFCYFCDQYNSCTYFNGTIIKESYLLSYWVMAIRDVGILVIQMYFLWQVTHDQQTANDMR